MLLWCLELLHTQMEGGLSQASEHLPLLKHSSWCGIHHELCTCTRAEQQRGWTRHCRVQKQVQVGAQRKLGAAHAAPVGCQQRLVSGGLQVKCCKQAPTKPRYAESEGQCRSFQAKLALESAREV